MDEARFRAILDAYGADPAHWPEAERADALNLAASYPELLVRARALDDALVLDKEGARADAALARRILNTAPTRAPRVAAARIVGPGLALAACALLGLALGYGAGLSAPDRDVVDLVLAMSFLEGDV